MRDRYGIEVYGGQGELVNRSFRVSTMGYVSETDIASFLYAAEKVLEYLK